jgi:vesicular inhibitory amino acid transporter
MRHPQKFSRALGISYGITFAIDLSMGIIGYLMFGKYVFEEVIPSPPHTEPSNSR